MTYKGTLRKKNDKWIVEFWDKVLPPNENRSILNELPLHPDEIVTNPPINGSIKHVLVTGEAIEVEFEIVICQNEPELLKLGYIYGSLLAKLITKQEELPNKSFNELMKGKQEESSNWDEIFERHWEECEHNHMTNFQDWLKEHYLPPVKR